MKPRYRFVNVVVSLALTLTALLAALPPAAVAQAVTCTVTSDLDDGTTPGTLRVLANDASCQVINFDDDYTIRFGSTLNIYRALTIDGSGHQVVLSGDTDGDGTGDVQMLGSHGSGDLTLKNLTLEKGARESGGAVYDAAALTVVGCTFSGNSASGTGYLQGGGAIYVEPGKTLTVANSTFTGNTSAGAGGAIMNGGTLTVINSTLSGNSASSGSALYNVANSALNVYNSILVGGAAGANCEGTIGGSNNLADDTSCGTGFTQSSAILLGALGNYGGSTPTLPLLPGSVALDAGDDAICAAEPVNNLDQRGIARPQGAHCDAGAFESQGFTLAVTGGDDQSAAVNTAFAIPLQVAVSSAFAEPVEGGLVAFSGPSSGASINPASFSATVDASGAASATATANSVEGSYEVLASVGVQSATFHLTNTGASYTLAVTGGDNQSTYVTTAFGKALEVTLKDGAGNPVPDVLVTFTAPATGASTDPVTFTATTNNRGIASATATANGIVGGPYEVVASTDGLATSFHLTNDGVTLALVAGDNQTTGAYVTFPVPLQVEVIGSAGKGVPGAVVAFSGPDSGASIAPALLSATSDKDGIASATVTANAVQGGPYEVVASIGDVSGTFHLTNQYPYYMESRCEANTGVVDATSSQGLSCLTRTTKEDCVKSSFCWWRDTAAQNALAEHSNTEFTGEVYQVYQDSGLTVLVYSSPNGPNVTAVIASTEALVIGTGGGREAANYARSAFGNAYWGFLGKELRGIVWLDADTDSTWGTQYWRTAFGPQVPIIANASYWTVNARYNLVGEALQARQERAYGTECTGGVNCTQALEWGTDGFLGTGSMRQYRPNLSSFALPVSTDMLISVETGRSVNGIPVRLIPTSDENAGLIVHLPDQHIVIAGDLGAYFPDEGSITQPPVSVDRRISALAYMRSLGSEILILEHALPIIGAQEAYDALTDQYDALSYVRSETVKYISYGYDVEDIVDTVRLPWPLVNSKYAQRFVGLEGYAVRQIYHEYLGWYDGDLLELSGGMSTLESASRLVDLAGGENPALNFARQCVTENSSTGARFALYVLTALRIRYPSAEADRLYVTALRQVALSTQSAELRNYFLSLANDVPLQ